VVRVEVVHFGPSKPAVAEHCVSPHRKDVRAADLPAFPVSARAGEVFSVHDGHLFHAHVHSEGALQ